MALGATRWTRGAAWNPDGSVDDAPNSGPINGVSFAVEVQPRPNRRWIHRVFDLMFEMFQKGLDRSPVLATA